MKRAARSLIAAAAALLLFVGCPAAAWAENGAPVAENLELRTYRNVSVGGRLSAFDPENDAVAYSITTEPVKGSIELEENGCFVYTPKENKRGRDYFGYKAIDSAGNVSQEAKVIIRIEKRKKAAFYSDLKGMGCEYAALALHEEGVFTAERIGGEYCFFPEREVSRGEFLAMCVSLRGQEPVSAVLRSGYSDDEAIPVWLKGFSTAAQLAGWGRTEELLTPDEPITVGEAEALLDRCLGLTEIRYRQADAEHSQACLNLSAHGIPTSAAAKLLSRAEAAEMLAAALPLV